MSRKQVTVEKIIGMLREAEVALHKEEVGRFAGVLGIGAKRRDEVLNREVFFSLKEAKVVIENWRQEYNTIRPTAASMACPCTGGYLAVGLSTASADRKQFGRGSTLT